MANAESESLGPPYPSPPIIEAVIEVRLATPISENLFSKLSKKYSKVYADKRDQTEAKFKIEVENGVASATAVASEQATLFSANDEREAVFLKLDRLIVSQRAPYCGWEVFYARFQRDIEPLQSNCAGIEVSRLGLRYRNRIDVPIDSSKETISYEDYLSANVRVPDILDPINSYTWRIDRYDPESGLQVMLASETLLPEIPGTGAFLLDIDVSRNPAAALGKIEFYPILSEMRRLKNQIFEKTISDKARAIFQ